MSMTVKAGLKTLDIFSKYGKCYRWFCTTDNLTLEILDMLNAMKKFWNEEEGLTSVEYAACGALVLGGIIVAFETLENSVSDVINDIATELDNIDRPA